MQRNEASACGDWTCFYEISRQLDYELSKCGDEAQKNAVLRAAARESWKALKADFQKDLKTAFEVAKSAWERFYEEFERGYEQARREPEGQSGAQSHDRRQESSSGRQSSVAGLNSFEKMWGHPAHETLGISQDASPSEIKRAWAVAISKYHPDSVNQSDVSAVRKATERAKEINTARAEMEQRRKTATA